MLKSSRILAAAGAVAGLGLAAAPLNVFALTLGTDDVSDSHEDQLVVTVPPTCTFGSYTKAGDGFPSGIAHNGTTDGDAAYGATTGGIGATDWTTTPATETGSGSDEGGHTDNNVDSTGYGILPGEGGVYYASDPGQNPDPTTATNYNASLHTVHRTMLAGTTTNTFARTEMTVVCNNGAGYTISATATALSDGAQSTPKTIPVNNTYSAAISGYDLNSITATGMTASVARFSTADTETEIAYRAGVSAETGDKLTVVYGMGIAAGQEADTYAGTVTYKLYKGVNDHS